MTPSSAKAKGRRLQQEIARDIVATFAPELQPDDAVSRSTGATGSDVLLSPRAQLLFPYSIEAKNVENINVWRAWNQAAANAAKDLRTPVLVFTRNHGERLAVITWRELLSLNHEIRILRNALVAMEEAAADYA